MEGRLHIWGVWGSPCLWHTTGLPSSSQPFLFPLAPASGSCASEYRGSDWMRGAKVAHPLAKPRAWHPWGGGPHEWQVTPGPQGRISLVERGEKVVDRGTQLQLEPWRPLLSGGPSEISWGGCLALRGPPPGPVRGRRSVQRNFPLCRALSGRWMGGSRRAAPHPLNPAKLSPPKPAARGPRAPPAPTKQPGVHSLAHSPQGLPRTCPVSLPSSGARAAIRAPSPGPRTPFPTGSASKFPGTRWPSRAEPRARPPARPAAGR